MIRRPWLRGAAWLLFLGPRLRAEGEPQRVESVLVERDHASALHAPVAAGIFGADMQVALVNDGPVTICLQY